MPTFPSQFADSFHARDMAAAHPTGALQWRADTPAATKLYTRLIVPKRAELKVATVAIVTPTPGIQRGLL